MESTQRRRRTPKVDREDGGGGGSRRQRLLAWLLVGLLIASVGASLVSTLGSA